MSVNKSYKYYHYTKSLVRAGLILRYSFMRILKLSLTLIRAGGGGIHPTLRRSAAISQGMIQMFSNFLTFSKMMLGPGSKSHFEHILNNCPENGPSVTKSKYLGLVE